MPGDRRHAPRAGGMYPESAQAPPRSSAQARRRRSARARPRYADVRRSPHQDDPPRAPPDRAGRPPRRPGTRRAQYHTQVFIEEGGVPRAQDNRLAVDPVHDRQRHRPIPAVVDQTPQTATGEQLHAVGLTQGLQHTPGLIPGPDEAEPPGELRSASSFGIAQNPSRPARREHGPIGADQASATTTSAVGVLISRSVTRPSSVRQPSTNAPRSSRSAMPRVPPAPARRTAAACEPGRRLAHWLSVHKPVDDLCRKAPDLSAHAKMLGIPAAGPAHNGVFNCKNTIHTLYTGRKLRLSTGHAATAHKWAERLP